jgi:Uncharacterized protein conserved in bacteria (DUF2272)/Bacterial SH3 domain
MPALATAPASNVAIPPRLTAAASPPAVVGIAKVEFDHFHGIDEGDEPLRSRIADYYEAAGGSRTLDPTSNDNAWSAAFVSFCMKQSGATAAQFKFSMLHSVYVHAAIANAIADRGVFRGHRVTEYAPKPGDLIHHNRSGGTFGFNFARDNAVYSSHSAIVVDFENRAGVRHAITIGGNEAIAGGTGTVGKKAFPLKSDGLLDQSAISVKLISVVENQLAGTPLLAGSGGQFVVNVRSDLKLRGGPGVDFPVIRPLLNGTQLTVLEFQDTPDGRWALVDIEGDGVKDGFVFAKFIDPVVA